MCCYGFVYVWYDVQKGPINCNISKCCTDTNVATLLFKDGHRETPPMMSKEDLADVILDRLLAMNN